MEDVVSFFDKIVKDTNAKISQTESILKQQLEKNECEEIQKTNQMKHQQKKFYINDNSKSVTCIIDQKRK